MTIKKIESVDNPQFKQIKKLLNSVKERRKANATIIDGIHLVQSLTSTGIVPNIIAVCENNLDHEEIQQCLSLFPTTTQVCFSEKLFSLISPVETPIGILAVIAIPQPSPTKYTSAVLLENIQDPGNLGSIMRNAAAAGIDAVYLSKGCTEAWSPKALRAGMGAQFTIPVYENTVLNDTAMLFDKRVATELNASEALYDIDLTGNTAFIFGNEGAGLSKELSQIATNRIKIPMPGNVESLNVASACAVCFFERVRQMEY